MKPLTLKFNKNFPKQSLFLVKFTTLKWLGKEMKPAPLIYLGIMLKFI